jgi:hypothetical protein
MTSIVRVVPSDDVADELYGLTPDRFLAVRDARVAEARRAGDAAAAAAISRLRKPSVAAWITNQLVRHHYDQVRELTRIGWWLRFATEREDVPALRELCAARRHAEAELRRHAMVLADEHGVRVQHRSLVAVGATFQAAMCCDDLARLLLAGRLSEALPRLSWPDLGFGEPEISKPYLAGEPRSRSRHDIAPPSAHSPQAADTASTRSPQAAGTALARSPHRTGDTALTRSLHPAGETLTRYPGDAGDELARRRALRLTRSSLRT